MSYQTTVPFAWMIGIVFAVTVSAADLRLVEAVKNNESEAVRALLRENVDVTTRQADGTSALMWAAHWDDLETADILIKAGAEVNTGNDHGVTPLSLACRNGSAAMVEKLLDAGAHPNVAERTGETPLMTCALTGSEEAVNSLLARGANVNAAEDRRGQTALMWAAAGGHADIIKTLIERGTDIHAKTRMAEISVVAVEAPDSDPELVQRTGANVNAAYDGTEVQATARGGFTAFLFAAQRGDVETARVLLAAGADVNESTPQYGNALVVAAASGQEELALFLLERGADPNVADGNGITALHYAVRKGLMPLAAYGYDPYSRPAPPNMPELVKALLARGANPNARINRSLLVLPTRTAIIRMEGATPFLLAAVSGDVALMRILAENGADPLLKGSEDTPPLMVAAAAGPIRENLRSEEQRRNALEAVKLAVELGADVNAVDQGARTAMHEAAYTGADAIIQFLADQGARVDVKDERGVTPWMITQGISPSVGDYAARYHESTGDLLIKLGARPLTPEEVAAFRTR